MAQSPHKPANLTRRLTFAICATLVVLHCLISLWAVSGKSATSDEPLHLAAGISHLRLLDFRADYEAPPLWKYWAALPHLFHPPDLRQSDGTWSSMLNVVGSQWQWSVQTIYRTPGNDADRLTARSRLAMALLSCGLATLVSAWAWKLAGRSAAVLAAILYCIDPNFLAHGPLVKNDIAFAGIMVAFAYLLWLVGRRITIARVGLLGVIIGAALCIKFTALLLPLLLVMLLVVRAMLPAPWHARSTILRSAKAKFLAAGVICTICGAFAYTTIWAVYGFRFAPTPDPESRLNFQRIGQIVAGNEMYAARDAASGHPDPSPLTDEERRAWRPGILMQGVLFANDHELLPHAWLSGLLYTHGMSVLRQSFLLGERRDIGWWYYFPLAFLFKTPTATLLCFALAACVGALSLGRMRIRARSHCLWSASVIGIPLVVYVMMLLRSNLDLGLRHALPVHVFLFIATGTAVAYALQRWRGLPVRIATATLLLGLAAETAVSFPNYIAFFNTPSSSAFHGGLDALSDSNLDWGQDLPLLAAWRKAHPDGKLCLNYFGTADPAYYGIDYINLPGGYEYGPSPQPPTEPGYLAISATRLQFAHANGTPPLYANLWKERPITILGKSIYVYAFRP